MADDPGKQFKKKPTGSPYKAYFVFGGTRQVDLFAARHTIVLLGILPSQLVLIPKLFKTSTVDDAP